jgi:MYXO-CTERM domain-containing protein
LVALTAILAATKPSIARADDVLVFQTQDSDSQGGDVAGSEAAGYLQGLGHNVTTIFSMTPTLPADLSSFDTVWVIQLEPIAGLDQVTLLNYVKGGGGLYLTGERVCCEALNASVQNLVNLLTTATTQIGNQGKEGGDTFSASPIDTFGITSTPNSIPVWLTGQAGLMNMIDPKNQVYQHPLGKTGAAAWPGEDMDKGAGCAYVAMDLSFWMDTVQPGENKSALTENIEHFLSTCNDSDGDGVSDAGEDAAGTNPDDPDSDGDGLCDGYATVDAVCIPGESINTDTDGDTIIDPLDEDDDGDGVPTSFEVDAELAAPDADGDNKPAWLDLDSDGNNIIDAIEGENDFDNDGIPSIVQNGDDPLMCGKDADCDRVFGPICDLETGYCSDGGGDGGGNQGGNGAGPGGNSPSGGSPANGGNSASGGNGSGNGGNNSGGGSSTDSDDDGCDCSTQEGRASGAGASAMLALALLSLRRRRSTAAR